MRVLKKHTEKGMRDAAIKNGTKGRSITSGAIGWSNKFSEEILDTFYLFIEESMPPLGGRGTRINSDIVKDSYAKFKLALLEALKNLEWNDLGEEE